MVLLSVCWSRGVWQLFPWIQRVNNATSPPHVHSVSYGGMESNTPASAAYRLLSQPLFLLLPSKIMCERLRFCCALDCMDDSHNIFFLLMVLACIRPVFSRCKRYLRRFNLELQKAGSRGLSILVAAGDSGVGCSPTGTNLLDLPYILDRQVSLI